jgi:hypothetical protein
LKAAEEVRVDVLSHFGKGRGVHVCEAGKEAGVHREGRGLTVGHAVLGEDIAQVFGLVRRDGAGRSAAGDVHAEELGEVTRVLDFEFGAQASFGSCQLSGTIAFGGNVVHIERDHGEDLTVAEDVDAWVLDALLPPIIDKPCTKVHNIT